MSGERSGYLAYLLRMWRVEVEGEPRWRASLEPPGSGERFVFGTLETTFDFLRERTEDESVGEPAPPDAEGRRARRVAGRGIRQGKEAP